MDQCTGPGEDVKNFEVLESRGGGGIAQCLSGWLLKWEVVLTAFKLRGEDMFAELSFVTCSVLGPMKKLRH